MVRFEELSQLFDPAPPNMGCSREGERQMATSIPQFNSSIGLSVVFPTVTTCLPVTLPYSRPQHRCSALQCSSHLYAQPLRFLVLQRQYPDPDQSLQLAWLSSVHSWDPGLEQPQVPGWLASSSPVAGRPFRAVAPRLAHLVKDRGVAPDPLRPPVDIDSLLAFWSNQLGRESTLRP
jgi:hypothetical protein